MDKSVELISAKINATLKILEWARNDIEPGIGSTAPQFHVALAEAFKTVYAALSASVDPDVTRLGTAASGDAGQASDSSPTERTASAV